MQILKQQIENMEESLRHIQSGLDRLQKQPHTADVINHVVDHVADLVAPQRTIFTLIRMFLGGR
jgi:hypothetical protein